MIVASSNGTISLPCDFSDPLCCTYVCGDAALDPAEIKGKAGRLNAPKKWPGTVPRKRLFRG